MTNFSSSIFTVPSLRTERKMPEVIAISGGQNGVGITFYSINLSILLRQYNKHVLLIDADSQPGNPGWLSCLNPNHLDTEQKSQNQELRTRILKGPGGVDIFPIHLTLKEPATRKNAKSLKKLNLTFSRFEAEYEKIVVDTGAGISADVMPYILGADRIILLTSPDPISISDTYRVIKKISQNERPKTIYLVINMIGSEGDGQSLFNKMRLMVRKFLKININFGGIIHHDAIVAHSARDRYTTILDYPNAAASNELCISVRRFINSPSVNDSKTVGYLNRVISFSKQTN